MLENGPDSHFCEYMQTFDTRFKILNVHNIMIKHQRDAYLDDIKLVTAEAAMHFVFSKWLYLI